MKTSSASTKLLREPGSGKVSRPFDEDGNFVRLTKEEIEAMSSGYYGGFSWRDGASLGTGGSIREPAFQGVIAKDRWTRINERSRTYHYANGASISVDGIEWVWVSSTGTHYLKTNSHIHIMKKDWVQIAITE